LSDRNLTLPPLGIFRGLQVGWWPRHDRRSGSTVSPTCFRGATRWPSPRSVLTFTLPPGLNDIRAGLHGHPNTCIVEVETTRKLPNPRCHLHVLRFSFRDNLLTWSSTDPVSTFRWPKPSSRRPSIRSGLLSWGCQRSPPSNATLPVHSCQFQVPKDPFLVSATTCQSCHSFRSCRSSRLQRFTPGCASRACCIPQPIMGFTTFPVTFSRLQGREPHRAVQVL